MTPISDQLLKLFSEHCENCPKCINCINTFHVNKVHKCTHWNMFTQVITEVDKYIHERVYNEFVRVQEENQRRIQND